MTEAQSASDIQLATREKYIVELLGCLLDYWSLMSVTSMSGLTWRVYDNSKNLIPKTKTWKQH